MRTSNRTTLAVAWMRRKLRVCGRVVDPDQGDEVSAIDYEGIGRISILWVLARVLRGVSAFIAPLFRDRLNGEIRT